MCVCRVCATDLEICHIHMTDALQGVTARVGKGCISVSAHTAGHLFIRNIWKMSMSS